MRLFAPTAFFKASFQERDVICNGCGPGKLGAALVPDTFWGLRITIACDIHDWMCNNAPTDESRFIADLVFIVNLILLIHERSNTWLKYPRYLRAMTYFNAVRFYGNSKDLKERPGTGVLLNNLIYSDVIEMYSAEA